MSDRMIRVDMTTQRVAIEDFPEEWQKLGGRGLSAKILLSECDPRCDPLGPDNLLIIAPGVLAGTAAPTSGRISIGGKSPLTGRIKEANAGGNPGQDLNKLGYRVIVVKGQPADPEKRYALDVDSEGARLKEVPDCKGLWNYALIDQLAERYSETASFMGALGTRPSATTAAAATANAMIPSARSSRRPAGVGLRRSVTAWIANPAPPTAPSA